jgi:predicted permease
MLRSFFALYRQDLGSIDTSRLLTMRLALPLARYPQRDTRTLLYQRIEERLRGVNAIQSAAITTMLPTQGGFERQLTIEGRPPAAGTAPPTVTMVEISNGYFDTLRLPVIRGRAFLEGDGTPGHEAAVVNERFVATHFKGQDPLGQRITLIDGDPQSFDPAVPSLTASIVGVVPSIRQRGQNNPDPDPVVFLPYRVDSQRFAVLLVRGTGDPASLTTVVRDEMRALEPDLPLFEIRTLDDTLAQQRWPFRVFGTLFTVFAIVALVLSAVGLYAVTAYSVSQRTQELGVRMALGAQPTQVMWLVLRRGLIQLAIGLPLGVAGAFGVGKLLESLLVQTSARDPLTIVSITALLVVVSVVACVWPARRATRLDPVSALRYE